MKTRNMLMKTLALLLVLSMGLSAAFAEGTVWESAKSVFYPDYGTQAEMRQAASELNITLASEGMVLLKNENGALPLGKDENKITLLGYRSFNLMTGGGGSGAGRPGTYGIPMATLAGSLEAEGFKVNQRMAAAYEGAAAEIAPADFTPSMLSSYVSYGDAAIITVSRSGSEGQDEKMHDVDGNADTSKHYLELTDAEIELVKHAKANFPKVILLVNSANVMEMGELNESKTEDNLGVDAILWIAQPGNDGAVGVARILSGTVNPSGHTVDTWERDFTKGPTYTNIGSMSQNFNEDGTRMDNALYVDGEVAVDAFGQSYHSVEYREGIYMGYRYYETAYDTAPEGEKEAAYENVVYPFGYGLSYTSFAWEPVEDEAAAAIGSADQKIVIRVKVTNTGAVAGKDVVQVYVNPPYTEGGIEKATANLVGFAKTKLLQPGESETVEVAFVAQDMASFDWNDANGNDFQGYELEAGTYAVSARFDSHNIAFTKEFTVAEGILCDKDSTTGNPIEAVFSQDSGKYARYYSVNDALLENAISRTDLHQPAPSTIADRTVDADYIQALTDEREYFSCTDSEEDPWYVGQVPAEWTQAAGVPGENGMYPITLKDLVGVSYTEPTIVDGVATAAQDADSQLWETFMNQLTWEELVSQVCAGDYGQGIAIPTIGKEVVFGGDGPTQFAWNSNIFFGSKGIQQFDVIGTNWVVAPVVAATWNTGLALEQGRMVGNESLYGGINEWYGPACDTHRSPFSGRNFEYYSEDGVLAGKIVSGVTKGAASKGVMIRLKHMFLNDQETNRNTAGGVLTWANEQAIREIYLKPYEIAVKEGDVNGGMTAFNRIGDAVCSTDYALLESIFRGEWNFRGTFVTDCQDYAEYRYLNLMCRTGQELPLGQTINMYNGQKIFDARFGIGYASAVEGTWSAEANCVLVAENPEDARTCETLRKESGDMYLIFHDDALIAQLAALETVPSPTHYYAVRKSAQRVIYDYVNSNNMKNALNRDIAPQEVTVTVNNARTSAPLTFDAEAIGTKDIRVLSAEGLPEGLAISAAGVITGGAAEVGEYDVELQLLLDNWVKTTAAVKIIVEAAAQ